MSRIGQPRRGFNVLAYNQQKGDRTVTRYKKGSHFRPSQDMADVCAECREPFMAHYNGQCPIDEEIDAEQRWTRIGFDAAKRALTRSGHADGFADHRWSALPADVQRDLIALWSKED